MQTQRSIFCRREASFWFFYAGNSHKLNSMGKLVFVSRLFLTTHLLLLTHFKHNLLFSYVYLQLSFSPFICII